MLGILAERVMLLYPGCGHKLVMETRKPTGVCES